MVGLAVGREMMEGLRGRSARTGLGAGSKEAWDEWAEGGRERDNFFMFFLEKGGKSESAEERVEESSSPRASAICWVGAGAWMRRAVAMPLRRATLLVSGNCGDCMAHDQRERLKTR